jgi:hypothetical protein
MRLSYMHPSYQDISASCYNTDTMPSKNETKKQLNTIREWLGVGLLAAAPFTFNPSISIPMQGFISFRLGLYQIAVAVFVLLMLPVIWQLRGQWSKRYSLVIPLGILVLLTLTSPLRSLNIPRSLLLSSAIVLLLLLLLSGWAYAVTFFSKANYSKISQAIVRVSMLVGIFALLQLVANTFAQSTLGLCANCGATVLGFPRVNGFSAEPQFFANALLPAILLLLAKLLQDRSRWYMYVSFGFLVSIVMVSLSRGGIAAMIVGCIVLTLTQLIRKKLLWHRLILTSISGLVAVVLGIALLTVSATIRYHRNNQMISKATFSTIIEQMSGGVINLPYNDVVSTPQNNQVQSFQSPGVIKASETDREHAASTGIAWWHKDTVTTLIGLGAGNLGSFAHQQDASIPLSFTIYVQYIFMLVEFGLLGLLSFAYLLGVAIVYAWRRARQTTVVFELALPAILVAFAFQYVFFGTYINVPYIWLYTGLGLGIALRKKAVK